MNEDDEEIAREFDQATKERPETVNEDLEIINNCLFVIGEVLNMDGSLYDALNEDKIKTVSQSFDVIAAINKKIINDYKKSK